MDADTQFWLTWSVRLVGTVGTLLAVVVALFGEHFRAKLFAPELVLELASEFGHRTPIEMTSNGVRRTEQARYYQLRLRNRRRWPPATEVQVYLVGVEEPGPNGAAQVRWSGAIPLKWDWSEIREPKQVVGPEILCNLCRVIRTAFLDLDTAVYPASLEAYRVRPVGTRVNITVKIQARATEISSPITPFRIAWDGQWDDGDAEMARHLIIEQVRPPVSFDPGAP